MSWQPKVNDVILINAGRIPVRKPYVFVFKYLGHGTININPVNQMQDFTSMGCSCTVGGYDTKTKEFRITYTPKAVPQQQIAKKVNSYQNNNSTTVKFLEDGKIKSYTLNIMSMPYDPNIKF
jgi:hypothetical protein